MVLEIVTTGGSNRVKLVIGQRMTKLSACCCKGIVKTIVRIIHLIDLECRFQAAFIEAGIVGYERDRSYLVAEIIDCLFVRIALTQPMNLQAPVVVVVRLRLDKTIETVSHQPIMHHDHSNGTDARWLLISRLEIYGNKVTDHISIVSPSFLRCRLASLLYHFTQYVFPDDFWCRLTCQYKYLLSVTINMKLTGADNCRQLSIVLHGYPQRMIYTILLEQFALQVRTHICRVNRFAIANSPK